MNLHNAKTHRSRSVEQALNGDEVVIARAGRQSPGAAVAVEGTPRTHHLGFLQGEAVLDCDLKADFRNDIDAMVG